MDLDFIYNRHSVRRFKPDSVPMEHIKAILTAATYAPSAKNIQNWHFVVIQNQATIQAMADIVEKRHLEIANMAKSEKDGSYFMKFLKYYTAFKNAPIVILAYAGPYPMLELDILKENNASSASLRELILPSPNIQNIGAAMQNLMLAAAALGYGTCWMTGPTYAKQALEALVNLNKPGYELVALTPLGLPDQPLTAMPRKPLEEVTTFI